MAMENTIQYSWRSTNITIYPEQEEWGGKTSINRESKKMRTKIRHQQLKRKRNYRDKNSS
jgi:hypothetical protein